MIKPFTSESWKKFWNEGRLKLFFSNFKQTLKHIFRNFFNLKTEKAIYAKSEYKSFMDSINDFIQKSKKSKEKKSELDRLSKYFIKLIECGEKNATPYKKSFGPYEYVCLLNNEDARKAGILFEKALYAKELLTKEEEKDFINNINSYLERSEKNENSIL